MSDKFIRTLGQGRFGSVHEVSKTPSDKHFSMKILPFTSESDFKKNEHEISKLKNNQHRNVVEYVETIEGDNAHFVVLELCSHSLQDKLTENQKLGVKMDVVRVYRVMRDVLDGIAFLHSRGEIYGDLKGSNVLIGKDGIAKLGDFGGVVGTGTMKTSNSAECGTMQYWAPVFFKQTGNTGSQIGSLAGDMWAFGLLLLEMLTSRSWIVGGSSVEIQQSVLGFDIAPICESEGIVGDVQLLLSLLLSTNPSQRISSVDLIRSNRLQCVLGPETPLSRFVTKEHEETKTQLLKQNQATVDSFRDDLAIAHKEIKIAENVVFSLVEQFAELVSRHLPFLLRPTTRTVRLIDRLPRFDPLLSTAQNASSFNKAVLSHFVDEIEKDLTANPLNNSTDPILHHTLLFFHTLITASSDPVADITQFERLLSIIRDKAADHSVPCVVVGSVLSHFCMKHSKTLAIITSPQYLNFLFGHRPALNRDGTHIELNDGAQYALMNPFLSPFRTTKEEGSAVEECIICSKRSFMPWLVEVKSDLIESSRLIRPNPPITTRAQLNRFLPITASCPSDPTVCALLGDGPTHPADIELQHVTGLLSTLSSKSRDVDENQFQFVRLDTLVDTISALLIDGKEMADPHTIVRVSSHLISGNKKKAFITPELIQILQNHLSDRIDSASALSTHTSILRLLLLLLNSLDDDTLPLRSSLVSFFTNDFILSLLPDQHHFEGGTESETLRSNSSLFSSFFSLLINVLLVLLRHNPSFADHFPFSSIVQSLEGCVSAGPDKASLLILSHHLLEVLLSCSSHSTFLAILDSVNNCLFVSDRIWESTTAHFYDVEPDENEAAPSTHSPLVKHARQTVLKIEQHTNLVTRTFIHRIQNDTESPSLLSLLFTNSAQQEVLFRRQDTFGSAFNRSTLSAEQVAMDPFFPDIIEQFGHFEKLLNDSQQRPSLLLSGNLFLRLFDLFSWLATNSFSFDINLVALSKIQFLVSCLSLVNIDPSLVANRLIRFAHTQLNIFTQLPHLEQSIFRQPQNDERDRRQEMLLPFLNLSTVIAHHLPPISPNMSIQLLIPLVLLHNLTSLRETIRGIPNESIQNLFQIIEELSTTVDFDHFQEKQTITARIKGICDSLIAQQPTGTFAESSRFDIPFFSSFTFVCFLVDPDVFSAILHVFNCQLNRRDGMKESSLLTLPRSTLATSIDILLQLFMTPLIYSNTPTIAKSIALLKSVLPSDFRITKQSTFSRDAVKPLFDRLTSTEETRPAAEVFVRLISIPIIISFRPIVSTPCLELDTHALDFLQLFLQYYCSSTPNILKPTTF
ncbi:putative serine/threonine protein kinase [Blattamonas nauphoetae]|uniref:non-specific serine/threonine protein kinase n=1 Tax=Blattamonas nauphoetae TaxID=2049346 RepID=A0ABQ9XVA9_9EUKA|nr:putative serine/threonine protein kinase [Blattamonas nauphoetae]